jgi:hypothetical protein
MHKPEDNRDEQNGALQAPPRLLSALQQLSKPRIFIPPTLDEAILRDANRHLVRKRDPKFRWPIMLRWAAAAAALIVMLAVFPQATRKPALQPLMGFSRADVNQDGQMDILDAFTLARQLRDGIVPNGDLDINEDGMVDENDVAALAARAVNLEKGGRS